VDARSFPWVCAAVTAACAACSALPDGGVALEYDRAGLCAGSIWRLLTGQMVHWTARMAWIDLSTLLLLGAWVEGRSRRRLVLALALSAALVGAGVHLLLPDIERYRGSSGLGSALFVAGALDLASAGRPRWLRRLALLGLLLLAAKAAAEYWTGTPLFSGPLPAGVEVVPLVHLLGGLGGGLACVVRSRRPSTADQGTGGKCGGA